MQFHFLRKPVKTLIGGRDNDLYFARAWAQDRDCFHATVKIQSAGACISKVQLTSSVNNLFWISHERSEPKGFYSLSHLISHQVQAIDTPPNTISITTRADHHKLYPKNLLHSREHLISLIKQTSYSFLTNNRINMAHISSIIAISGIIALGKFWRLKDLVLKWFKRISLFYFYNEEHSWR